MTAVVLRGDAAHLPLPDGSVDLVVTSPPYWKQRDYRDGGQSLAGQIGSEATWQEYIANLLDCTREWMRVLKPQGSLFVNIADKYATRYSSVRGGGRAGLNGDDDQRGRSGQNRTGAGEKSLLGLPWRYALACIDDLGLILRRDNIWHKVSALPESADDRCVTRHEYVFHLTLQPDYYAATDEVREPHSPGTHPGRTRTVGSRSGNGVAHRTFAGNTDEFNPLGKLPGSVWEIASVPLNVPERIEHRRCCGGRKRPGCTDGLDHHAAFPPALAKRAILGWSPSGICLECGEGRFPVSYARPAETRPWALAQRSGRSWHGDGDNPARTLGVPAAERDRRILGYACACAPYTNHPGTAGRERAGQGYAQETGRDAHPHGGVGVLPRTGPWREYHLDDWTPPPTRPAVVVDPCGGTGTAALVADVHGRTGVTFDRSMDYCHLARWRTRDPGERARALGVPKPPPVPDGQGSLFDDVEAV